MNKYIFSIFLLFLSCRTVELKSDKFSTRVKDNNEWGQFSDWQSVNYRVRLQKRLFGLIPSTLTIYDDEKSYYRVKRNNSIDTTDSGEEYMSCRAKDKEGNKCLVIFINKGENVYTVICYDDVNLCYNIVSPNDTID